MGKKNHLLIIAFILNEIFNNIIFFGVSFRIIIILLLMIVTLKRVDLKYLSFNNYLLSLYFVYVIVTTFATIFSGNFTLELFGKKFFGYYSITLFYAIVIPNIKLNIRSYKKIIKFIVFIAICNFSLIILQYFGFDIFWIIPGYFSTDYTYVGNGMYNFSSKINQMSPVGLIDFTVTTGYLNLLFAPFYHFINKYNYKVLFVLLLFFSSLMLGQRSVIILLFLFIIIDFFLVRLNLKKIIYLTLVTTLIYYSVLDGVLDNVLSYKLKRNILEDTNREMLVASLITFMPSNFFLGGVSEYFTLLENRFIDKPTLPHNLFLNSFVIGGVFSFLLSIWLFISYFKFLWKNYFHSVKPKTFNPLFMSCLLIMLNSLFHNQGFSTNDNLFFLIFAISNIKIYHDS